LDWHFVGQRNSVGVAMQYLGPAYHDSGHKDVIVYAGEGADHEVITVRYMVLFIAYLSTGIHELSL